MTPSPRDAIRSFGWDTAQVDLLVRRGRAYLSWYGWHGRGDGQAAALEVKELINKAVERVLEGKRNWISGHEGDVVHLLSRTMRSIVMDTKRAVDRHPVTPGIELEELSPAEVSREAGGGCDGSDGDEETPLTRRATAAAGDDDDCGMLLLAVEEGHTKREDIAVALDWTPERVSVVRKKLQRRMATLAKKELAASGAKHE